MPSETQISDLRLCGFYQLKELLGLGDERLRMVLAVGEVKPIMFTNTKTGKVDKMYSLFSVKEAIQRLQGVDVQMEYESVYVTPDTEVEEKFRDVNLRLINKRKTVNG